MKIITEPTVAVVGSTIFTAHPDYPVPPGWLLDSSTLLGGFGAKACYDSWGENTRSPDENQRAIIKTRHGSVLEHFNISIFVEGITRACSHEIVRHRAGFGYSQRSTRYTDEGNAAIVLAPYFADLYLRYNLNATSHECFVLDTHIDSAKQDMVAYEYLVSNMMGLNPLGKTGTDLRKWARGNARNSLPHCLETKILITGNLRAWRFFIEQRSERYAEAEIRRLSNAIFPLLQGVAPLYFEDYTPVEIEGFFEYQTEYRKV